MADEKITVRIPYDKTFYTSDALNPIHGNIAIIRKLRNEGIPVDGGIEIRGVTSGRLTMWNEHRDGQRFLIYEWSPIPGENDNRFDPDL